MRKGVFFGGICHFLNLVQFILLHSLLTRQIKSKQSSNTGNVFNVVVVNNIVTHSFIQFVSSFYFFPAPSSTMHAGSPAVSDLSGENLQ